MHSQGPRTRSSSYCKSPDRRRSKDHRAYSRSRSRSRQRRPPSPALPPASLVGRGKDHSRGRKSYSRSPSPPRRRHATPRANSNSHSSSGDDKRSGPKSRCIGVFGLSVITTQQKIREIFDKFGAIEKIQVIIDAQTGISRGFCFIYYVELADAKAAKQSCTGMVLDGRRIRVDYSITQRPHTPTPGIYMGRPTKSYRRAREYHDRYRQEYRSRRHSPSPSHHHGSRKQHQSSYHSSERRRYERSRSRSHSPPSRRRRH